MIRCHTGGLIGKIAKVEDNELQIDVAKDVRITIVRSMILTVRSKPNQQKITLNALFLQTENFSNTMPFCRYNLLCS